MEGNHVARPISAPLMANQLLKGRRRNVIIIVVYVTLFWFLLPVLLWTIGRRFEGWLRLAPPSRAMRIVAMVAALSAGWPLLRGMLSLWTNGKGLPISHLPPTRLVRSGVYAWVRHPIYLFFVLTWSFASLAAGSSGSSIVGGLILVVASVAYARAIEEPRLHTRFGEAYATYASRTPIILPVPERLRAMLRGCWNVAKPAVERLANHTVLVRGKHWSLVTYGAFVGLGAFIMALWSGLTLGAIGVDGRHFFVFSISIALLMLISGRLGGLFYRLRLLRSKPIDAMRTVGFVSWGGYVGMVVGAYLGARWLGLPPLALLDRLVLPGLACSAIGRFGCLSYGCCTGRPWPPGICYSNHEARIIRESGPAACVPRLPTQLVSAAWATCVLALLWWPSLLPLPGGVLAASACLLYSLGRIAIEQTRDEDRFGRLKWTRGQYVAAACGLLSLLALLVVSGPVMPPASRIAGTSLSAALAAAVATGTLTLVIAGVHGRRVGYW